jgi:hypothetical protein
MRFVLLTFVGSRFHIRPQRDQLAGSYRRYGKQRLSSYSGNGALNPCTGYAKIRTFSFILYINGSERGLS